MSQDLWDLVSDGFVDLIDPTEDQTDDVWFVDRQEQNPVCRSESCKSFKGCRLACKTGGRRRASKSCRLKLSL